MSDQSLHVDMESFSRCDLKKTGAARYANDPSTEILCCAFALGDEEPYVWKQGEELPDKYWEALVTPQVYIWAHHAQFEMFMFIALAEKTWGVPPPALNRFKCTMSLARRAALPAPLEKLGEVLQLENLKDNKGKALIRKFSIMQSPKRATKKHPDGQPARRIFPTDEPEAFEQFCQYCAQDVRCEQGAKKKLIYFDDPLNARNYSLDAVINARGVPVNLTALRHAQKLIDEETEIVSEKFRKLCGFEPTQNKLLLEWINSFDHMAGSEFANLQAGTIEEYLEEWNGQSDVSVVTQALRLKQSIAYASIKKIKTMLACAGPFDNRLRGMHAHHAATTGRWGGQLVQVQNFKRSTINDSDGAYRMICEECSREELEICYGPVLEVISSSIRHFIHDV